ncbi:uncharacterized protein [Elaeis guineensis]|uniref:uncharacterized protein n=1 Tax=Elaeis guineensis var. tenera TaxID=51953 RepID=UPI003C6D8A0A
MAPEICATTGCSMTTAALGVPAFEESKQYLSSPPLLAKPQSNEELLLYLTVSLVVISAVLVQEEGWIQKPIYYTSKILHDVETRYSKLEKLIFALIITVRKLQPYFQAQTIVLPTDQSMKTILHHPNTSRWIAKWALELWELDMQYYPRPSIKAQVLADFIMECTIPNGQSSKAREGPKGGESSKARKSLRSKKMDMESNPEELWTLHADGSSNAFRAEDGLILIDPKRDIAGHALHFHFSATNNEAEYEALIASLKVAREVGAQHLKVPRAENAKANALSKLATLLPVDLEKETYF